MQVDEAGDDAADRDLQRNESRVHLRRSDQLRVQARLRSVLGALSDRYFLRLQLAV